MTIYVTMVADRHTDPEPYLFTTAAAAIAYAEAAAAENATDPDDIEEEPVEGWLYYARYSVEGDSVWVLGKEIDAPETSS